MLPKSQFGEDVREHVIVFGHNRDIIRDAASHGCAGCGPGKVRRSVATVDELA